MQGVRIDSSRRAAASSMVPAPFWAESSPTTTAPRSGAVSPLPLLLEAPRPGSAVLRPPSVTSQKLRKNSKKSKISFFFEFLVLTIDWSYTRSIYSYRTFLGTWRGTCDGYYSGFGGDNFGASHT